MLTTLLPLSPVTAQGTQADYDRSAALSKSMENKVYRQTVNPHWLEGSQKFWYRIDTGPEHFEFILVDAVAGTRQPAFDHQKLAAALTVELKKPVDAGALPFTWIYPSPDGKVVRFRIADRIWQFDAMGKLSPSDTPLPEQKLAPLRRVHPSRNSGDHTVITFINRLKVPVTLFWVTTESQEKQYQTIQPGTESRMQTYVGHVWKVKDSAGKVVGIYDATPEEALAILEKPDSESKPQGETPKAPPVTDAKPPSPNGRAFVRDFNLWVRATDGKETQLTTTGKADNYFRDDLHVSPDGRYVAVSQVVPEQEHKVFMVESSPTDQLQPKLKTIDYLKPGDRVEQDRVRLFDLQTRHEVPTADALFSNQWSIEDLGWREDGQAYRFLFNQRGHQHLRVLEMALDGQVRAIVDESSPTFIDYSQKTTLHEVPGHDELIWASERDGWNHLYLVDTKSGTVKNQITKGNWVMRSVERVDDEKRQIWFRAFGLVPEQDPYYAQLARINFDGSGLTMLTEGDGNHDWKWSPDRKFLIDTYSRVDSPPTTTLRDGDTGREIYALEKADAQSLLATGWTLPERFEAVGRDGKTPIYGVIVRPSNFDPTRKYPVIENIYAGPQDFFTPKAFGTLARFHELAELGFIVVQIDGMGTNWRSRAFHDVCWKNLKDSGFPDRIAWMKAAQTTRPWMDLTRVGIFGVSAGGQNALSAVLFYGDFYRAAIADSGCYDNRMDKIWWNEAWMGWPIDGSYADSSGAEHAKNLQGDLMLIYGELDTNVDPASTMQVVNALIKAGKDFDLLAVPGGGHGAGGSAYGTRRQNDFFVRHLLGVQPPSAMLPETLKPFKLSLTLLFTMRYAQLPATFFEANRQRLTAKLPEKAIAILNSNDVMPTNADGTLGFCQNSDLYYLSGVDQEESVLVLFPGARDPKQREILFVRETSELLAIWEGAKLTKELAREVSGIQTVFWTSDFERVLRGLMVEAETAYLNLNEHLRQDNSVQTRDQRFVDDLRRRYPLHNYARLAPIIYGLRMFKSPEEVDAIRRATVPTGSGFLRLLKFVKPGVTEFEVEAELIHEYIRGRSRGFSYPPIIASGANACVLHYVENNATCQDGELLLLDVAAEYANYHSDMTRTIPVSGRFTLRQKDVYNAVLRVLRACSTMLRPGVVPAEYQKEVNKIMEGELIGLGLLDAEAVKNQDPEKPLFRKYFMHGVSHHIGLDVHDVHDANLPYAEGMVLTVEPGIYIREEGFAVRLENLIVIGAEGSEDLMKDIPIEADEIEALMQNASS